MTDFKVGDRVIVDLDTPHSAWHKAEGVVTETRNSPHCAQVKITKGFGADGIERTLYNLTLLPFTYEDIQKGDRIRRTKVYKSGATEVREGVAAKKAEPQGFWADEHNQFILAYDAKSEAPEGITYELLERPEPPAPKLWENRKPGDQLITYEEDGSVDRIFTKRADGRWNTFNVIKNGMSGNGFARTDRQVAEFVTESTELIES